MVSPLSASGRTRSARMKDGGDGHKNTVTELQREGDDKIQGDGGRPTLATAAEAEANGDGTCTYTLSLIHISEPTRPY